MVSLSTNRMDGCGNSRDDRAVRSAVRGTARSVLAEGARRSGDDAQHPMEKMLKGCPTRLRTERLRQCRPEAGGIHYRAAAARLEGNTHIKWLRRLDVSDKPFMTREETSKYAPTC